MLRPELLVVLLLMCRSRCSRLPLLVHFLTAGVWLSCLILVRSA